MEDEGIREERQGREGKVMEGEGDFVLCPRKKKNRKVGASAYDACSVSVCRQHSVLERLGRQSSH